MVAVFVPVLIQAELLPTQCDLLVAGAGTGGWGTAVQAARMGCSVLLMDETDWIGGQMNAAGVTSMDEGPIIRQQGIYHEFYERAVETYQKLGKSVGTCYYKSNSCAVEPRIGQKILYDFIREANQKGPGHIEVSLRSHVVKVFRHGHQVQGADVESVRSNGLITNHVECTVLVDATEYGDVLPLTGARYRIGKSTSDNIDLKARIQDNTWTAVIKEYPAGIPAELQITAPPPGYAETRLKKHFDRIQVADDGKQKLGFDDLYGEKTPWRAVAWYRGMPDSSRKDTPPYYNPTRTHLNIPQNDMSMTVGDVVDPAQRWTKEIEMRLVTLQLLYHVQHELKLSWSVANDEGYDSPYNRDRVARIVSERPSLKPYERLLQLLPPIAYVRESRRMIGVLTLVGSDISRSEGPKFFADAISVNDYSEDFHGARSPKDMEASLETVPTNTTKLPYSKRAGPFQLPFPAFIPESLDGFLAAEKNLSQSRRANGATRLQPSTMLNGQAVGVIAALAIKNKIPPRAVDPIQVQKILLDANVQLVYAAAAAPRNSPEWKPDQLTRLLSEPPK